MINYPDGMTRADWRYLGEIADPIARAKDILEGHYEWLGRAPRTLGDVEDQMRRLGLCVDGFTGYLKISEEDLEEIFEHLTEYFEGYFEDEAA